MFKKVIILMLLSVHLVSCKTETLKTVLDGASEYMREEGGAKDPSKYEIGLGLKEALSLSIEKGAQSLSVTDGYFKNPLVKLLLPPEAQEVERTLRKMGLGRLTDNLIVKLNRAAEDAALKSVPIFKEAILQMSFQDVMAVLTGPQTAATTYLKSKTSNKILSAFKPSVSRSLSDVGAVRAWSEVFSRYNRIPFVKRVNPDLVTYTTNRALVGLFVKVASEESKIRKNLGFRRTTLLKRVFGYADRLRSQ